MRSSGAPRAVSSMIGTSLSPRSSSVSDSPSWPGIMMSSTIRSKAMFLALLLASIASAAVVAK